MSILSLIADVVVMFGKKPFYDSASEIPAALIRFVLGLDGEK